MVRPEDITSFLDVRWFSTIGEVGKWISTVLISIVCLATLYILYNYLEHRIRLIIFPIFGTSDDVKDLKELEEIKQKFTNVQIGIPKTRRGKVVKQKGVKKFQILKNPFVWKKIPNIGYEYIYPEGIWMIEPTKDYYLPIKRPDIKETVNIKVPENDMDFWMQLENEELLQRTKDEDSSKRQMYMTAIIIIGAFILAGIVIWVSMSFAGQHLGTAYEKADSVINSLSSYLGTESPG